jgi:hypothetical protein
MPVYVWECVGQPGDYGFCTNKQHPDFQTPNWKFKGEVASVPELSGPGFPQQAVETRTANGHCTTVHVDRHGNYIYY